ncbi:MAG: transporter substrate-binding domain-containing protein [Pseudomonadota bacterium]
MINVADTNYAFNEEIEQLMKYIFLFFTLALFATTAFATEQKEKAEKIFRIGVSDQNHYPLFDFTNADDMGLAHKILSLFAERNGFTFEYKPMNYVKLQDAIEKGDIDFIFPDNPKWRTYRYTREHNIYSLPFMQGVSSTFVSNENSDITIDQVKSVAIPYGYSSLTWYAALEKYGIDTITTSGLDASMQYLYRGTVMAADIEYNVANHLAELMPNLGTIVVNKNLPSTPARYHLSTIKHILVIERFSHFASKNQEQIEQLRHQYGIKTYEEVFGSDGKSEFEKWLTLE